MFRNGDPGHLLRLDGGSLYEVTQEVDVDQARMLLRDLGAVEYDQGWDATDAVASGDRRLLVDIDLGETGARLEFLRRAGGAIARHGPHQGAQKSTITGTSLRSMCLSKFEAVSATGSPGKSRDLQEPHTASAAGRSGATRLTALQ
jgi:hypothetical protein